MNNVLITGATGGIGKALVNIFHKNGYNIVATGTNSEKLDALKENYKERLNCIKCDFSDLGQIEEMVNSANNYYGHTSILINNAGITKDNLFLRMKDEEWSNIININLNANYKLTKLIIGNNNIR